MVSQKMLSSRSILPLTFLSLSARDLSWKHFLNEEESITHIILLVRNGNDENYHQLQLSSIPVTIQTHSTWELEYFSTLTTPQKSIKIKKASSALSLVLH
mmetsp:Transcript_23574/g.35055  ORF Transcript_23574/g.35055 Transcript_23574/m.35055 type:complete len:100 (+) Transcript_23574:1300-1599(+)